MSVNTSIVKKILYGLWKTINGIRKVFLNLIFLGLIAIILMALSSDEPIPIENSSALELKLAGSIVDQKKYVDPWQSVLSKGAKSDENSEILLQDVINVVDAAANDPRIKALVLNLSSLSKTDLSKLQTVGDALLRFKQSGKPITVNGNFYNQQQYYLASFANDIYLNPKGGVMLNGLARYSLYFKSALEKLNVNTHVFRVGTFKSAVEPLIRNNMSDEAKKANLFLMDDLWRSYAVQVAKNRNLAADTLALSAKDMLIKLDEANGSSAEMAINMKWVDKLLTYDEFNQAMVNIVGTGANGHSYKKVSFKDYEAQLMPREQINANNQIGIITAKGTILNGKQPAGSIGGESTSALLRRARYNDDIKAVVIRIDSPGGSAFASAQIHQELLALKAAGKPVVVSMGGVAASGGYWIAADADYIFATPTTITGSIGIFGMFATFEDTLNKIGINSDGVATTDWAGLSVMRPLSPQVAKVIQHQIEKGYQDFIELVAHGRHMPLEKVDEIAQGRVWTGKQALNLGLVDELGDLQNAVSKAASLAKLDNYDIENIDLKLSPEEIVIQEMFSTVMNYLPQFNTQNSMFEQLISKWSMSINQFSTFDDPNGVYLFCDTCSM